MEYTGPSQPIEWRNLSGYRLRADIEIGLLNGTFVRNLPVHHPYDEGPLLQISANSSASASGWLRPSDGKRQVAAKSAKQALTAKTYGRYLLHCR